MNKDKKYRKFVFYSWIILLAGAILLVVGFIELFFLKPLAGISLKYQQPVIHNGSFEFIIGIVLFPVGIYRVTHLAKAYKKELDTEEIIKELKKRR